MVRIWQHHSDPVVARVEDDTQHGHVIVDWLNETTGAVEEQCDGWVEGDTLFVPSDGQGLNTSNVIDDAGQPYADANWYNATTGVEAVVIPTSNGVQLATLI